MDVLKEVMEQAARTLGAAAEAGLLVIEVFNEDLAAFTSAQEAAKK